MQDHAIDINNGKLTYTLQAKRSRLIYFAAPLFMGIFCWSLKILYFDFNGGSDNLWSVLLGFGFLTIPFYFAWLAVIKLLWSLFGKEYLEIDYNGIYQERVLFYRFQKYHYPKERIRDISLKFNVSVSNFSGMSRFVRYLMISEAGRMQFFIGNKPVTIAENLSDDEVKRILNRLKRWGYDVV